MRRHKRFVPFKRKLQGKTDYRKRLVLLKSGKPRLVVRKSLNNISTQIIAYETAGDKVLAAATSRELLKLGWTGKRKNMPAAYLTGYLCGIHAKKAGITEAIFDAGFYTSVNGSVVYAVLKGAIDSGLKIPHNEVVFPPEDRIKGKHIKGKDVEAEFEAVKKKIGVKK
ncbi:MAG: 50S ribosomal protein L18 [Nanoarchaeota archaeon]